MLIKRGERRRRLPPATVLTGGEEREMEEVAGREGEKERERDSARMEKSHREEE